jgi:hypothetical protein
MVEQQSGPPGPEQEPVFEKQVPAAQTTTAIMRRTVAVAFRPMVDLLHVEI